MSDIKSKIFVVFVIICILTIIVGIAWLIQYGITKFVSSEPEVTQISLPTEEITPSPEPIEEVTSFPKPTQEPDKEDENKDELNDKIELLPSIVGGYEFGEYDKFNSYAKDNGLDGTKIYVYGTCTQIVTSGPSVACYLENGDDKWLIILWDTRDAKRDFSIFVDREIYVFGEYSEFSDVAKRPGMIFETIVCDGAMYDKLNLYDYKLPTQMKMDEYEVVQTIDTVGGYEFGEYDKFNSYAEDNGLKYTKIFIYGTCTEITTGGSSIGCLVENGDDKWLVGLWEINEFGEKDFSFLVGKEIFIFGKYMGFSDVWERPGLFIDTIICDGEVYDLFALCEGRKVTPIGITEPLTEVLSDKVSYDVFIERFDEKVKMSISDEYEFVEVEPNVFKNILTKDGEEICLIRLKVEDGYITEAYYTSSTQRYWNESLDMRIIFQVSMFGTIPPSEYGEYDSFGNYDVTFNITAIRQSISVFYRE